MPDAEALRDKLDKAEADRQRLQKDLRNARDREKRLPS